MRLCATCEHDGQCEGLPYCDGRYYSPAAGVDGDDDAECGDADGGGGGTPPSFPS